MQDDQTNNEQDEETLEATGVEVIEDDKVTDNSEDAGNSANEDSGNPAEDAKELPLEEEEVTPVVNGPTEEEVTAVRTKLHTALVKIDGRLANPDDLPYSVEHLDNPEALDAAITALIESRPGLRARSVSGDIGQGTRGNNSGSVDLIELMRAL